MFERLKDACDEGNKNQVKSIKKTNWNKKILLKMCLKMIY